MAGIDKTYCDDYETYFQFKQWADKQTMTFYDGHSICVGDWVWEIERKDFSSGDAIMNTPMFIDAYLVQHCPFQFVLDSLESAYGNKFTKLKQLDLTGKPHPCFKRKRKINWKYNKYTLYKPVKEVYSDYSWFLQAREFWYNEETKTWAHYSSCYPITTGSARFKTPHDAIKHLRKQYLPKGITFNLRGKYIGENYDLITS